MDMLFLEGTEKLYAQVLHKITGVVKEGSVHVLNVTVAETSPFEAILEFYCAFLAFGLQKMNAKQASNFAQLALITIKQNSFHGEELFEILTKQKHTGKDEVKKLGLSKGPIVIEILSLLKFLLKMPVTSKKPFAHKMSEAVFREMMASILNFMEQYEVYQPLVFFCENFPIIIGWLAGYFASQTQLPEELLLKKGIKVLRSLCLTSSMRPNVSKRYNTIALSQALLPLYAPIAGNF